MFDSEIVASLKSPTSEKGSICLHGTDELGGVCCIDHDCTSNCSTKCIKAGFNKGGECNAQTGCCCFT